MINLIIFNTIQQMKNEVKKFKFNKSIGFVPTMGYLHEGHLFLVENSKRENDVTVVSIFVNPTQFGPNEDFEKYPRNYERDLQMLENLGVDYVFMPEMFEIYPEGYSTYVEENILTKELCGKSRPTHFRGVTTIVNKLFNIVSPDKAYFGQKDAQQFRVLRKMVEDLNMNVELIECPIIREEDGLAKSSRNVYLTSEEREQATALFESLNIAKKLLSEGECSVSKITEKMKSHIETKSLIKIDYISILKEKNLSEFQNDIIDETPLIAVACFLGKTRLIDNLIHR